VVAGLKGVRERVCARDCMSGYVSCWGNGEVVREGVCALGWVIVFSVPRAEKQV